MFWSSSGKMQGRSVRIPLILSAGILWPPMTAVVCGSIGTRNTHPGIHKSSALRTAADSGPHSATILSARASWMLATTTITNPAYERLLRGFDGGGYWPRLSSPPCGCAPGCVFTGFDAGYVGPIAAPPTSGRSSSWMNGCCAFPASTA